MFDKFWSPKKLLSKIGGRDIPLRIIVGPNRIGKTYGMVSLVVETVLKEENVLWMRMFDEEFKGEFTQNFINIMHQIDDNISLSTCEQGICVNGVQRVYFRSLNVFGKARGNGSTTGDVTLAVLDEFIPEDGRVPRKGVYLPMMALIRTFSNYSSRCVCYCLANCITPLSDLFATLKAFPRSGEDVTIYEEKGVAIEVCRGYEGKIPKDNGWKKVAVSGRMPEYKEFEGLYIDDFIVKMRSGIATRTSIKFNDSEYINLYSQKNLFIWCVQAKPPTGVKAMGLKGEVNVEYLDEKISKQIRRMFYHAQYRFNDYNTLNRFLTIFNMTL